MVEILDDEVYSFDTISLLLIITRLSPEQLLKALLPIVVTLDGIVMLVSPVQSENA